MKLDADLIEIVGRAWDEILSDPTKWTQGVLARDKAGFATDPQGVDAVRWCSLGAFLHCGMTPHQWESLDELTLHCANDGPDGYLFVRSFVGAALAEEDIS